MPTRRNWRGCARLISTSSTRPTRCRKPLRPSGGNWASATKSRTNNSSLPPVAGAATWMRRWMPWCLSVRPSPSSLSEDQAAQWWMLSLSTHMSPHQGVIMRGWCSCKAVSTAIRNAKAFTCYLNCESKNSHCFLTSSSHPPSSAPAMIVTKSYQQLKTHKRTPTKLRNNIQDMIYLNSQQFCFILLTMLDQKFRNLNRRKERMKKKKNEEEEEKMHKCNKKSLYMCRILTFLESGTQRGWGWLISSLHKENIDWFTLLSSPLCRPFALCYFILSLTQ